MAKKKNTIPSGFEDVLGNIYSNAEQGESITNIDDLPLDNELPFEEEKEDEKEPPVNTEDGKNKTDDTQDSHEDTSDIPEDIIRIKGYVYGQDTTYYFNYVLNEYNVFEGPIRTDSLVSVIGTEIDEAYFKELFNE